MASLAAPPASMAMATKMEQQTNESGREDLRRRDSSSTLGQIRGGVKRRGVDAGRRGGSSRGKGGLRNANLKGITGNIDTAGAVCVVAAVGKDMMRWFSGVPKMIILKALALYRIAMGNRFLKSHTCIGGGLHHTGIRPG